MKNTVYAARFNPQWWIRREKGQVLENDFFVKTLPSPCTAFSQSLSVNSFRRRIRGERAGNASHFRKDHVTRKALAARKNEA